MHRCREFSFVQCSLIRWFLEEFRLPYHVAMRQLIAHRESSAVKSESSDQFPRENLPSGPSSPNNAKSALMTAFAHTPRKRFGQHFLRDPEIVRQIVLAISPQPGQHLLEIGPGEGAITLSLLRLAKTMTAIELDRDLAPRLAVSAIGMGELTIINADVLGIDLTALAGDRPLRIIGNLPYNISSPILFHCLDHLDAIEDMHFMLQKEVVDRMAADPGSKTYGRLSVMVQLACRVEPLIAVPPAAFRPPPKVDSTVVRLLPRPRGQRPVADSAAIARVVRAAFGQRRKTLSNALGELLDAQQIAACGIDPRTRAEQLVPNEFVALARALTK